LLKSFLKITIYINNVRDIILKIEAEERFDLDRILEIAEEFDFTSSIRIVRNFVRFSRYIAESPASIEDLEMVDNQNDLREEAVQKHWRPKQKEFDEMDFWEQLNAAKAAKALGHW